jgi:hypothetical protein
MVFKATSTSNLPEICEGLNAACYDVRLFNEMPYALNEGRELIANRDCIWDLGDIHLPKPWTQRLWFKDKALNNRER